MPVELLEQAASRLAVSSADEMARTDLARPVAGQRG